MAQRFGFTVDSLRERNTDCIPDGKKFVVSSKIKTGLVILVRYAG
jgi:hypothetical protein